jgi:ribonuclease HI
MTNSASGNRVVLHTDGACRGNPGPGGWGAILEFSGQKKELYGHDPQTTNNRMEMTAVIESLKALKRPCQIDLHTDSKYVLQGMTEWLDGWKKKGWKTAAKKPVKNVDLWQQLDEQAARHQINWHWVKGHSGNPGNEKADQLANRGIDEAQGKA